VTRNHRGRTLARQIRLYLLAVAAIGVLSVADDVIRHGALVLLAAAGTAGGFVLGRRFGRRDGQAKRAALGQEAERLTGLVGDLENATGRPIETVTASYRAIGGKYRIPGSKP